MGTEKKNAARTPAESRNSGKHKTAKTTKTDSEPDSENAPPVRPRPKPVRKHASAEEAAAAALISMGTPSASSGRVLMDRVPASDLDNLVNTETSTNKDVVNDERPISIEGSDNEDAAYESHNDTNASGDEEIDEELDAAVRRVVPTVKIPAKFPIPFDVPYKTGFRRLTGITSRTSFDDFIVAAAIRMDTRVTLMSNIAYTPSYAPKNPKPRPKLLEDDDAWDDLVAEVGQYIKASQAKNRGKGEVMPFSIVITDLFNSEESKTGTGKKVGGKKGKKNEAGEEQTNTPALKEHELFKKIEEKNYCQACKAACVVLDSGDHPTLTHTELATWAMLASRHQAVINEPPKDLGLDANHARQKRAKNHQANAATSAADPPAWFQAMMPMLGVLLNNRAPAPAPAPPGFWQAPSQDLMPAVPRLPPAGGDPSIPFPHLTQSQELSFPGTKRPPPKSLIILNNDPLRGRMKLNYVQYGDLPLDNGLFELSDLANVSAEKLLGLPGGERMNFGIANRLVTYAKEDFELFSAPVSKRPRV
ncbi:hypothetical protein DFH09DRAFT_1109571 [Mycena vulgaris]|nr:hypothetical protein DFH09DRAFT_1109571 [Mycena vulgaris]